MVWEGEGVKLSLGFAGDSGVYVEAASPLEMTQWPLVGFEAG